VSASGAEERSSSLRGGAFRAMDKSKQQQTSPHRSFFATFQHLFLPGQDPSYIYWCLGAITLIGAVIRLWQITQPVGYDEAYTFVYYATQGFKHILADYSAPNNHIFHTILVRLFYEIFGKQPWVVRGPALLAGILCIPAAYFFARRIFDAPQSLAGAALVALTPWFINYSVNGRGYTLIILFSLLLANLGALLTREQSRAALVAYAIVAGLGFYTIPIFLYPMAGVSLWVLVTLLTMDEPWQKKSIRVRDFLLACLLGGVLTLLLYLPVIVFGTGFRSITSNEIVESRAWSAFLENIPPRVTKTWESWMMGFSQPVKDLLIGGFLLSLIFYRKASSQRLPLQVFLVLAVAIILVIQHVAPLARVWMYLDAFFLIFAAGGLVWLAELVLDRLRFIPPENTTRLLCTVILLIMATSLMSIYRETQQGSLVPNRGDFPEQYAAEYLASHLQPQDRILSVSPVDIQTAFYLYLEGVPYDVFYQRDHPAPVENAVIVLRTNSKYNTPEEVLQFYRIAENFDPASAQLVYEYGPVQVFSIPAR
jgi:4-amino-4-deoxy-L-arabinose transferase-like glycosyltransferase